MNEVKLTGQDKLDACKRMNLDPIKNDIYVGFINNLKHYDIVDIPNGVIYKRCWDMKLKECEL